MALLSRLTFILALLVILLGAFTRLSDAGLGCPDWPGCYGAMIVPSSADIAPTYQSTPLNTYKAWVEMVHRYAAGSLGLLVLVLVLYRRRLPEQVRQLPALLLILVITQALLGMWTVTLKLMPVVVLAHLLGGFLTLSLIAVLNWRQLPLSRQLMQCSKPLLLLARFSLIILLLQIALGAWTAANYAGLSCGPFVYCDAEGGVPTNVHGALFGWLQPVNTYQYGVLPHDARQTIHMAHRFGAIASGVVLIVLALWLWLQAKTPVDKGLVVGLIGLLGLQVALGVMNVVFQLPLLLALMHNAAASLLLLVVVLLNDRLRWIGVRRSI